MIIHNQTLTCNQGVLRQNIYEIGGGGLKSSICDVIRFVFLLHILFVYFPCTFGISWQQSIQSLFPGNDSYTVKVTKQKSELRLGLTMKNMKNMKQE